LLANDHGSGNCCRKQGFLPIYDAHVNNSDLKDPDDHVIHFTQEGMGRILKDCGASFVKKIPAGWLGYGAKFD